MAILYRTAKFKSANCVQWQFGSQPPNLIPAYISGYNMVHIIPVPILLTCSLGIDQPGTIAPMNQVLGKWVYPARLLHGMLCTTCSLSLCIDRSKVRSSLYVLSLASNRQPPGECVDNA